MYMMESFVVNICLSIVVIGSCSLIVIVCEVVWLRPRRIRSALRRQGIRGPPPTFLLGNIPEMKRIQTEVMKNSVVSDGLRISHNWSHSFLPYLRRWSVQYGEVYMYSTGMKQHLYISRPDLMKEFHLHQSLDFGRSKYVTDTFEPLLGHGIVSANGQHWAYQKKLLAPEFFLDKVKDMMSMMVDSTITMIERWETQMKGSVGKILDTKVDEDLRSVSADIISRTCFGTSYAQGKIIFTKIGLLQESLSKPGALFHLFKYRCLPTKNNREVWMLKKEIDTLILKVIKDRQNGKSENDLLQKLVDEFRIDNANIGVSRMNRLMIDICKNIYFAGYETGAITVSWCLMLLASNPEWQDRVRHEILQVFGPNQDYCRSLRSSTVSSVLPNLKLLTMVIQETLRLYSPAVMVTKEAFADITFGDITVPKGTTVWNLIPELHQDRGNWGPDAGDFNPQRFSHGVSQACKHPHAYMPFGYGTRQCLGQTFAMVELKIVLSLVLSKFSFSISPDYCHSPVFRILLAPEHGVRLLIKSL